MLPLHQSTPLEFSPEQAAGLAAYSPALAALNNYRSAFTAAFAAMRAAGSDESEADVRWAMLMVQSRYAWG